MPNSSFLASLTLIPSIKVVASCVMILLISSSQSDCSSNTDSIVSQIFEPVDHIGSCFTRQQSGYLESSLLISPNRHDENQGLTVTGSKYHF